MAARKPLVRNNHLEEAMALLIRNQAAFVEQIARNDQERLALQRNPEQWQLATQQWQLKTEEGSTKLRNVSIGLKRGFRISRPLLPSYPILFFKPFLLSYLKRLRKKSDSNFRCNPAARRQGAETAPRALTLVSVPTATT
jgi:hypothetical protein